MYSYIFIVFLILVTVSCQNQQQKKPDEIVETNANSISAAKSKETDTDDGELVEFFSDDSKIGLLRRNKIELSNFKISNGGMSNSNKVKIKFYSLAKNKEWKLKQTFELEKYGELPFNTEFADFNGDGFKDITYVSDIAARGANEIRQLFIYDKKKDELVNIKNSGNYPNLRYNKNLDCIDAWLVYGGNATVFLKIDGDVLKEFASVENFGNTRTISLIDKNGKEKVLRKDKIKDDDFHQRYKNFNPLEPYEDEESYQ